jgi:cell division transport system permease protein
MSMNLQYIVREGFLGLKRMPVATFITVTTVAITLFLLSLFLLLILNVGQFVGIFQETIRIDVYVADTLDEAGLQACREELASCPGIRTIEYISPENALEHFRQELGSDPLEILGENPLPASFSIYLEEQYRSLSRTHDVVRCLESCSGVAEVEYNGKFIQLMDQYKRILFIGTFVLFVLVFLATLFLVSNTLRLTIYAQKDKIEIMELIGATPYFIRRPYLIQGILQGLMGGLFGSLFIWILVQIVALRFPNLLAVPLLFYLFPLVFGMLLGLLGSVFGIRRFLKA